MLYRVLKTFNYSFNGIDAIEASVGEEVRLPDNTVRGLRIEGYIETVEPKPEPKPKAPARSTAAKKKTETDK